MAKKFFSGNGSFFVPGGEKFFSPDGIGEKAL
jgi:hypothetical protein